MHVRGGSCPGTTASETLTGTPETDYIYADEGDDRLLGRGKFDDLRGEEGNDKLDGGDGSDQYNFSGDAWGSDRVIGDAGGKKDWLIFQTNTPTPLMIDLIPSPGQAEVVAGLNSIQIARDVEIEWVQAGLGADQIFGSAKDNQINGSDEGDLIVGRAGDDSLYGDVSVFVDNEGDDEIRAGKGEDLVSGVDGNDTIYVRDGQKDDVECGDGTDTVAESDAIDEIDADCETVLR